VRGSFTLGEPIEIRDEAAAAELQLLFERSGG
jgi:hypothetical protein